MSETGVMLSHMPNKKQDDVVNDFNPFLTEYASRVRSDAPGAGSIFAAPERELIVWQTRPSMPSEYELSLSDALERIFGQRIYELADVVDALNHEGVRTPRGEAWT